MIDLPSLHGRPIIIGAGLAGLMTALRLAPEPVVVVSNAPLGTGAASGWAQGGIAASIGLDDDPEQHLADTLAAGDGLCNPDVARRIVSAGPAVIDYLAEIGVRFDRAADGSLALGLEAAHGRRRIVHAEGDATGREIMRAMVEATRATPSITLLESTDARHLCAEDGRIVGVVLCSPAGALMLNTERVVVATGGIGGLFNQTTNPAGCFGQGLALAARAGATLADLEFIQFHPTALDGPSRPMKLISEAVRGEGAILIDETGRRFMADEPGAELAPRDVVARAVWRHLAEGHGVLLDARQAPASGFARRFPAIDALCQAEGFDPSRQPIPIRPAAHYHMGGIKVDTEGRSSVRGLWACGEVASTCLHGANRLASNSLLEAAASAAWVAESVAAAPTGNPRPTIATTPPTDPDATLVRPILSRGAGVLRDRAGLLEAIDSLYPLAIGNGAAADPAIVGLMIAVAALQREESRGAHYRTDFPMRAEIARHSSLTLNQALAAAEALISSPRLARSA
jgi:L-aspartate oxidase